MRLWRTSPTTTMEWLTNILVTFLLVTVVRVKSSELSPVTDSSDSDSDSSESLFEDRDGGEDRDQARGAPEGRIIVNYYS